VVESAEIAGVDEGEVSPEIREALKRLVGQPFDQQSAEDLVSRLQADLSDVIITTRLAPGDQSDRVN